MNCNDYLEMEPVQLLEVLTDTFIIDIPEEIDDVTTLQNVSKLMSETINAYSFLVQLYCLSKISTRHYKRLGASAKKEYEDSVDRKEIIKNILDAVLLRYKVLSRMVTIKQEINEELNMSEGRTSKLWN